MTATLTPTAMARRAPTAGARVGYALAIAVNAVLLWVVHQLLAWGWPSFLTDDFERLLPIVSASFVASMVVNAGFMIRDRDRAKAAGDLVTATFGLVVSLRTWDVFPFDFTAYTTDWSTAIRVLLVIGIVGSAIGIVMNLVKLVRGEPRSA
jgi:hypothetical protein